MPVVSECCAHSGAPANVARDRSRLQNVSSPVEKHRRDRVFHAKGVCQPQTKGRSRPSSRRTSTQPMGAHFTEGPRRRGKSRSATQTARKLVGQSCGVQAFVRLNRVLAARVFFFFIRSRTSVIVSYRPQIGPACGGDIAVAAAPVSRRQSLPWALF